MSIELAPGIFRITTPLPFRPREVHAYLLELAGGEWLLVDGGADLPEAWTALDAGVTELAGGWDRVSRHFVTHMHLDHIGLVGQVRKACRPELLMGRLDADRAAHAASQTQEESEYRRSLLQSAGAPQEIDGAMQKVIGGTSASSPFVTPDVLLPMETAPIPGAPGFSSVWTPGHTAGHTGIFRHSDRIFIGGDSVLPRVSATIGVNRQRQDPVADFLSSLEELTSLELTLILPGHGEPLTQPQRRIDELASETRGETAEILRLVSDVPATPWQIAKRRYPDRELPPALWMLAIRETLAHLHHLRDAGIIVERKVANTLASEFASWEEQT
ncbi:MAG TPA: MBL fold metallo-hydrolase [Longimicrobiaceae bacterium]|nr:MBL fold metallo-hydrolase [Longimicrobiaceae bacterium]